MADANIISLNTMIEPIERFFEREYPNPIGLIHEPPSESAPADLVYLEKGINGLHAVRFEEFYDDCIFDVARGIHALHHLAANFHWIALPLDEFRDGEEEFNSILENEAAERGYGIITVQHKGRGISAKKIVDPSLVEGSFIDDYPNLLKKWRNLERKPGSREGYQVVDFY